MKLNKRICVNFHCNLQKLKQLSIPWWIFQFYINLNSFVFINCVLLSKDLIESKPLTMKFFFKLFRKYRTKFKHKLMEYFGTIPWKHVIKDIDFFLNLNF